MESLKKGEIVKVADGRIGRLINFKLYPDGHEKAPGRAVVEFIDAVQGVFKAEMFSVLDVSLICPHCSGTGRVIESDCGPQG